MTVLVDEIKDPKLPRRRHGDRVVAITAVLGEGGTGARESKEGGRGMLRPTIGGGLWRWRHDTRPLGMASQTPRGERVPDLRHRGRTYALFPRPHASVGRSRLPGSIPNGIPPRVLQSPRRTYGRREGEGIVLVDATQSTCEVA